MRSLKSRKIKQWVQVVGWGVFGFAVGCIMFGYSLYPPKSVYLNTSGIFLIGVGSGYLICAAIIRKIENRNCSPEKTPV